jgi:hypothetical protein
MLGDDLRPDWQSIYTIAEAEEDLSDFHWRGVGWYSSKSGDWVLVLDAYPDLATYHFFFWSGRDPRDLFKMVAELPVKQSADEVPMECGAV